jgi:hypothetical protein
MATTWYNVALTMLANGELDLEADDIRVLILETDDPDNLTTQRDRATVAAILATAAAEATSTGYSRQALASKAVTQDNTGDLTKWDATDVTFATIAQATTEVWKAYIVYQHNDADDALNIPILRGDIADLEPNGEDIHLRWHANGIARLKHPA